MRQGHAAHQADLPALDKPGTRKPPLAQAADSAAGSAAGCIFPKREWHSTMRPATSSPHKGFCMQRRPAWVVRWFLPKENHEMKMPKTISGWCMVLFFLWYGLAAFVPALAGGFFPTLAGLLALGVAVFTFLGM